jgi:outer membrane biosynthesis protein TonB
MRFAVLLSLAALLGAGCALLVACGSSDDDLVPERDAAALKRYADRVGEAAADQDCQRASADVQRALDRVNELPSKVDRDLRANLEEGFTNLAEQAARECQETTETTPPETTPPETTPPETTPPETTPPETTPPETTPPETTPPEPPPPGENGGDEGDGATPSPGDEGRGIGGAKGKGKAKGRKRVKGE